MAFTVYELSPMHNPGGCENKANLLFDAISSVSYIDFYLIWFKSLFLVISKFVYKIINYISFKIKFKNTKLNLGF